MDQDDETDLPLEVREAVKMAVAVLQGSEARIQPADQAKEPASESNASLEAHDQPIVELRHITSRDEIPITQKHVLVMWGLATSSFAHLMGETFVVNNSPRNADRDREYREGLEAAERKARSAGLSCIYVLE